MAMPRKRGRPKATQQHDPWEQIRRNKLQPDPLEYLRNTGQIDPAHEPPVLQIREAYRLTTLGLECRSQAYQRADHGSTDLTDAQAALLLRYQAWSTQIPNPQRHLNRILDRGSPVDASAVTTSATCWLELPRLDKAQTGDIL